MSVSCVNVYCSTSLPLASTIWFWSTTSFICPLSSKQQHRNKFSRMLRIKPRLLGEKEECCLFDMHSYVSSQCWAFLSRAVLFKASFAPSSTATNQSLYNKAPSARRWQQLSLIVGWVFDWVCGCDGGWLCFLSGAMLPILKRLTNFYARFWAMFVDRSFLFLLLSRLVAMVAS